MKRRFVAGVSLIETIVALVIGLLVGAACFALVLHTHSTRDIVEGVTNSELKARRTLDVLADSIRNAQPFAYQSSPPLYTAISAASQDSITYYTSSGTTRLFLDRTTTPGVLKRQIGTATPTVMLDGVTDLLFTYYKSATTYQAPAQAWTTTANPAAPTDAEEPKIGAVTIRADVVVEGRFARRMTTHVRLRNSPL